MAHVLASELRKAVLETAIRGNLSSFNPEDTPIQVTLDKMSDYRKNLFESKKEKPAKPTNEVDDIELFEIPDHWKWVQLGDVGTLTRGSGIKKDEVTPTGKPCIRYGQLYTTYKTKFDKTVSFVSESTFEKSNKVHTNDIVMALTGENNFDIALAATYYGDEPIAIGGDMTKWSNHYMNPFYLVMIINSDYGISWKRKMAKGNIIVHISNDKLANIMLPLPPIEEQARIVARVDELMAKIDEYEKLENELVELKKNFPGDMKAAVLQAAMQGKLTEQLESDSDVFKYIRNATSLKNSLIKKKEIKKDKTTDSKNDETPFDIPDNWTWAKLGNIAILRPGKTPPRAEPVWWGKDNEVPWVSIADMVSNGTVTKTKEYISKEGFEQKFNGIISPAGTMIMSFKLTIGRISILGMDALHNEAIISIFPFIDEDKILQKYLFKVLPYLTQYGNSKNAIKGNTLNADSLCNLYVPLPPIEEQRRIIEKLDQLLPLVESLEIS